MPEIIKVDFTKPVKKIKKGVVLNGFKIKIIKK